MSKIKVNLASGSMNSIKYKILVPLLLIFVLTVMSAHVDSLAQTSSPILGPTADYKLLWSNGEGNAELWTVYTDGSRTSASYYGGPGWRATSYDQFYDSYDPDPYHNHLKKRLLWSHTSGQTSLWSLDGADNFISSKSLGVYLGWTATSYKRINHSTARILWSHTSGWATLWVVDANDDQVPGGKSYNGTPGWTANSYEKLSDGTARILWTRSNGEENGKASLWNLDASDNFTGIYRYYFSPGGAGWTATSYQKLSNGTARILWTLPNSVSSNGQAILQTLDTFGNPTGSIFITGDGDRSAQSYFKL